MTVPSPTNQTPLAARFAQFCRNQRQELEPYRVIDWERTDPETVHKARVLSRRLRASNQVIFTALPGHSNPFLKNSVKRVTQALRAARSWDVCVQYFSGGKLPKQWVGHPMSWLNKALAARSQQKRKKIKFPALSSVLVWEKLLKEIQDSHLETVLERLNKQYVDKLVKTAAKFIKSKSKDDLHQTRIAMKIWRYHQEILQYCLSADNSGLLTQLKRYQGLLGHFNDGVELSRHLKNSKIQATVDKPKRVKHFRKFQKKLKEQLKDELQEIYGQLKKEFMPWLEGVRS